MTARLCGCGCGTPLTDRQRQYASRACAGRSAQRSMTPADRARAVDARRARMADPVTRDAWLTSLRKAKARERLSHWWASAHVDALLDRLERRGLVEDEHRAALAVVLAGAMRDQYQRGYRVGWAAGQRRKEVA